MRRAFTSIQKHLVPQTVLFLGDLFDGGREWTTATSKSPEKRWHKYGNDFWMEEYRRFGKLFIDPWVTGLQKESSASHHKLLASLPGNHDLGFSTGIQLPVRKRFHTFFGDSNRVDIIGNHSFVSVDTVSLSAKSRADLGADRAIWGPADEFVHQSQRIKAEALGRELAAMFGNHQDELHVHNVTDTSGLNYKDDRRLVKAEGDMPTILLSHVPLFRDPATPCGPLRERWPPSKAPSESEPPLAKDEQNAIRIHGGYQYQNVVDKDISSELVERIGGVEHVFSGDDHDYCELVHKGYTSRGRNVREITVKSISWAMGVRKPGFLLVSLWNPIDQKGASLPQDLLTGQSSAGPTLQSHLCLLPDQLSVFIRYLVLFACTVFVLAMDALWGPPASKAQKESYEPLLPISNTNPPKTVRGRTRADSTSFSTNSNADQSQLASRSNAARSKTGSPADSYGFSFSKVSENQPDATVNYQKSLETVNGRRSPEKQARSYAQGTPLTKTQSVVRQFRTSLLRIASAGFLYYAWLAVTV
jgi:hypothetical protein